jgi:hypothetical protein
MKIRILTLLAVATLILSACNVHGGGWIDSSTGSGKATFGFTVNCTQIDPHNLVLKGHVQYNDQPAGIQFHGEIEQPYTVSSREISCDDDFLVSPVTFIGTYTMQPSGQTGGFTWTVRDFGEPGPSAGDLLRVALYEGPAYATPAFYENGGGIQGGNIQYR